MQKKHITYICPVCKKPFSDENALYRHLLEASCKRRYEDYNGGKPRSYYMQPIDQWSLSEPSDPYVRAEQGG